MRGLNTFARPMHACFSVDEIVRLLACELVASEGNGTAVALARCCKSLEDPVLDVLWGTQVRLYPLLETFPESVWDETAPTFVSLPGTPYLSPLNRLIGKVFKGMPTTAEWARFKKYSRRMRELELNLSEEPIPPDVLSVLQLRALNETLLPNLKALEFRKAPSDVIPFIPLFLSHATIDIDIQFTTRPPVVMIASMIVNLPTLCPHLQSIGLQPLTSGNSTITHAVSEMFLACNPGTLRCFFVDSALTEEACRAAYRLPNLEALFSVFREPTSLPEVSLPNLANLDVEYYHDHDWLRALRGATLSKLETVIFHAECEQIGDFLEAFETVALATSAAAALSTLKFHTSRSWNPSYYSLLSFKQLKELVIQFSCRDGCSSRVDDEIIITLAQAMPKLEVLQLGKAPCQVPSNVTVQGLIALSNHCIDLSELRIHFQTESLMVAILNEAIPSGLDGESHRPRGICALTSLAVGEIPMPPQCSLTVALALLRIFPHLLNIEYTNEGWESVAETITLSKQIDSFVHRSGKTRPLYIQSPIMIPLQDMRSVLKIHRGMDRADGTVQSRPPFALRCTVIPTVLIWRNSVLEKQYM